MKKTFIIMTALFAVSAYSQAQTADEIINKNIAAMGGMEKLNSIKSIYEEDSINAGGVKIPLKCGW